MHCTKCRKAFVRIVVNLSQVRGSVKSLGAEYTKERISERISEKVQNRGKALTVGSTGKRLIDTSQDKFQQSAGLKRWAEIENLKTAASAYSKVNSIADLETKIAERSAPAKESREKLTILERKMKSMAETIKYARSFRRWNRRKKSCSRLAKLLKKKADN